MTSDFCGERDFRHLVHLLPGETILELGCGEGLFTRQLLRVSRGENPITSVAFDAGRQGTGKPSSQVEFINLATAPDVLRGRQFDYVVAINLLDESDSAAFVQDIQDYLKPGGQVVLYESNPWNVVLKARRLFGGLFGKKDPRRLLTRTKLYEMISELGFVRVFTAYNDFMYAPLTRSLIWFLRNLSIILENTPVLQTLAGAILIHAQKPPRIVARRRCSLFEHEELAPAVSVVIPCHNEEMNIRPLVTQLKELYGQYIHEIIPVHDNSKDGTADVLRELAASNACIKPILRSPPAGSAGAAGWLSCRDWRLFAVNGLRFSACSALGWGFFQFIVATKRG